MKTLSSLVEDTLEVILIDSAVGKGISCESVFPVFVEALLNRKGDIWASSDLLVAEDQLYSLIPEEIDFLDSLIYEKIPCEIYCLDSPLDEAEHPDPEFSIFLGLCLDRLLIASLESLGKR